MGGDDFGEIRVLERMKFFWIRYFFRPTPVVTGEKSRGSTYRACATGFASAYACATGFASASLRPLVLCSAHLAPGESPGANEYMSFLFSGSSIAFLP